MKILVTGGLGAVGVPLTEILRANGHEVWVLDRYHHHGVRGKYYFRADVGEYRQMQHVMDQVPFDFVYHAAAEFGRVNGEDFYETLWRTNAVGTKNLIRLQEQKRYRMVIFSSSEIYGEWKGLMEEDTPSLHPIKQLNDYAITKWVNELQAANSVATHGTETVTVRLFNTYGPGEPYSDYRSVVCKFVYCALHDLPYTVFATHHRSLTYIDDTCRTLAAIAGNFEPGAVYNIASGTYVDMKALSDMILSACGKTDRLVTYAPVEHHNTLDKRASTERALRDLGHKDTVSLEEGIRRTVSWQREYYSVCA
jgi:dTDP-glucose 4,6-dehydratase